MKKWDMSDRAIYDNLGVFVVGILGGITLCVLAACILIVIYHLWVLA